MNIIISCGKAVLKKDFDYPKVGKDKESNPYEVKRGLHSWTLEPKVQSVVRA